MSAYGKAFSTRLFIQAAFTGLLAPLSSRGSSWLLVTFVVAAAAAAVAGVIRNGHERARELVIGFEAVAVAVGVVGLLGHHYIPGTIVGVAALITAINHPAPVAAPVMAQSSAPAAVPPPAAAAPPVYAPPVSVPPVDVPAPTMPVSDVPASRAMNILPNG